MFSIARQQSILSACFTREGKNSSASVQPGVLKPWITPLVDTRVNDHQVGLQPAGNPQGLLKSLPGCLPDQWIESSRVEIKKRGVNSWSDTGILKGRGDPEDKLFLEGIQLGTLDGNFRRQAEVEGWCKAGFDLCPGNMCSQAWLPS